MARTKIDAARELCRKFPKAASRSLGRKLYAANPEWFTDERTALQSILRARGAAGEVCRKNIKTTDVTRPLGIQPEPPPSDATPWLPFEIEGPCKVLSLSDIHCPYHNDQSLRAAVAWGRTAKPNVLFLNGDIGDFYSVSHWERDPKKRQLREEIDKLRAMLIWLCESFPKARIVYKQGNHEERLTKFVWSKAPELWDMPQLTLEGLLRIDNDMQPVRQLERVEFVGDQRPVMLGKLPSMHGHELPKGLASPVNPARGAFLRTMEGMIVAHSHRSSSHTEYTWTHKPIVCWSQGCLCDLNPAYARINKWNHGFALIEVASDGNYDVQNKQILPDGSVKGA